MTKYKIYTKGNYIVIVDTQKNEYFYGIRKEVHIDKSNVNKEVYRAFNVKDFSDTINLQIPNILKEDNSPYTEAEFDTFYQENTGNFNGGGTAPISLDGSLPDVNGDISLVEDVVAISGTGNTVIKFDKMRYYGTTTQTGDITFSLDATPNINKNGRIQVIDIDANVDGTLTVPVDWVNSNGILFENSKNNVIYLDYINGKVKYNISIQDIADIVAPTLVSSVVQNHSPSDIILTYNEALTDSSVPDNADFVLNLSKTVTGVSILDSVVTITVNSPYENGDLPTISYTGGTNKIKDLAGNNADNLVNQVITNNVVVDSSDDFNSSDITDIVGRLTPIGSKTWLHTSGVGNVGIVNNEAKLTSSSITANEIYLFDAGIRNVDKTFTIGTMGSGLTFYVAYQDADNYISVFAHLRAVLIRTAGVNTILVNEGISSVSGDSFRVILTDTTITVNRNGGLLYTGTAGVGIIGTKIGFNIYQDGVSTINSII